LGLDREELGRLKPVYHLALSAAKDPQTGQLVDRYLDDEQWADIAREFMDRMGLARRGDDSGVRWVAVRHADDHVHVVATLAAPGRPASSPVQRPLPGDGGQPVRGSQVRAHRHRSDRPHRGACGQPR
jgi:hypothetical protein